MSLIFSCNDEEYENDFENATAQIIENTSSDDECENDIVAYQFKARGS